MKNHMIYSTLASSFLMFVFGILWHEQPAAAIFEQHTWLTIETNWYGFLALIVSHSLLLSLISWLYIKKDAALIDGVRIGVITGLLVTLFFGFQLMLNVSVLPLNFLERDMVNLSGIIVLFYVASGVTQGLIFHALTKRKNHNHNDKQ